MQRGRVRVSKNRILVEPAVVRLRQSAVVGTKSINACMIVPQEGVGDDVLTRSSAKYCFTFLKHKEEPSLPPPQQQKHHVHDHQRKSKATSQECHRSPCHENIHVRLRCLAADVHQSRHVLRRLAKLSAQPQPGVGHHLDTTTPKEANGINLSSLRFCHHLMRTTGVEYVRIFVHTSQRFSKCSFFRRCM